MKAHFSFTLCLASIVFLGGCRFHPHGGDVDFGVGDLADANHDMAPVDSDGGANGDMPNLACAPNATSCADANTLVTCNTDGSAQTSTMCPLGCGTDGSAHCKVMQPTAPVTVGDLNDGDLTAPASFTAAKLVFDVSNGQILDASSATSASVREANATSGREVHQGIAFHVSNNVAIWSFKGLTIPASTTVYFDNSKANHAAALVSTTDATIAGTIDGRAYDTTTAGTCVGTSGGPGGGAGATSGVAAAGDGAGASAKTLTAGGGGAGFGVAGGAGGDDTAGGNAGAAGAVAGEATLSTIRGGFGGGFGGANGGGGGGSVQLVANGTLTFAGGSVVNVGGCGGSAGAANGGGGGGSGGGVIAEALTLTVTKGAFVVANGGGGGGGGDAGALLPPDPGSGAGAAGGMSLSGAAGGAPGNVGNAGGEGCASKSNPLTGSAGAGPADGAGGGGGGMGRIRFNTLSGNASIFNNTLSPSLANGQATQGVVVTK